MYVKPLTPSRYARMTRLLLGYGLSAPKLAEVLDVTPPTARGKLYDPARLTLGDVDRINRFGHVPLDELREAI
jgi:hypothetical protein